jgi:transcriptional regulator with XRE-family HTH domain
LIPKGGFELEYQTEFEKLGKRYRKLRLARKMVQEDVIGHGFSVRHYQQLESGRPHSLSTFFRVSEMFSVNPEKLIKGILNVRRPQ